MRESAAMELFWFGLCSGMALGVLIERFVIVPSARHLARHVDA